MIKKIYCFGTSHTRGAGFHIQSVKELYKNVVDNPSMDTCSWPGILQTYLEDIDIYNLAECGAGNERIYRLVFDLVTDPKFKKEETLLLLELSDLGRKEYYSNTMSDYVICNYDTQKPPGKNFDVVTRYYQSDNLIPDNIKKIYSDFLVENVNFSDLINRLQMNLIFFLNFLESNKIKFELIKYDDEIFSPQQLNLIQNKYKGVKYKIAGKVQDSFYDEVIQKKYLMGNETDGVVNDFHQGYWINEIVANTIYNHLINQKYFDGIQKIIKSEHQDFLLFKKKLNISNFII